MKKIFRNNRIIAIAFMTFFAASAFATPKAGEPGKDVPVSLSYAGSIQEKPMFELSFNGNKENDDFTITISDEWGNRLYRENIKAENFSKKFLLNTEEIGDETLTFEVISNKTGKKVLYEVNRFTRTGAIALATVSK
jgi:hypothetical protein